MSAEQTQIRIRIRAVWSESLQGSLWMQRSHSRSLLVLAGFLWVQRSNSRIPIRDFAGLSMGAKVAFVQSDQSPCRAFYGCKGSIRAVWHRLCRALYGCKGCIRVVWSESLQGSLWMQRSLSRSLIRILTGLSMDAKVAFEQSASPCRLSMGAKV